jgi:hypothetical protein
VWTGTKGQMFGEVSYNIHSVSAPLRRVNTYKPYSPLTTLPPGRELGATKTAASEERYILHKRVRYLISISVALLRRREKRENGERSAERQTDRQSDKQTDEGVSPHTVHLCLDVGGAPRHRGIASSVR